VDILKRMVSNAARDLQAAERSLCSALCALVLLLGQLVLPELSAGHARIVETLRPAEEAPKEGEEGGGGDAQMIGDALDEGSATPEHRGSFI
jgi:hypothetical protein